MRYATVIAELVKSRGVPAVCSAYGVADTVVMAACAGNENALWQMLQRASAPGFEFPAKGGNGRLTETEQNRLVTLGRARGPQALAQAMGLAELTVLRAAMGASVHAASKQAIIDYLAQQDDAGGPFTDVVEG